MRARLLRAAGWLLVAALCVLRFRHLAADFPNFTPWFSDQAKYTDEGWWAGAAVMQRLTGHWHVAGDYTPALAVPVWPLLLSLLFHETGVSIVAARALSVFFSEATIAVVFLLVKRYSASRDGTSTALLAAMLLAASPFAFVFSRLAILESLTSFEFCLLLLVASYVEDKRILPWVGLTLLTTAIVLTKTTTVMLLPGVVWLAWMRPGSKMRRATYLTASLVSVLMLIAGGYQWFVRRACFGADFSYFFSTNRMPEIDWSRSFFYLRSLFGRNCLWVDPALYPLSVAAIIPGSVWLRALWKNPLFVAAWMTFLSQCGFILRRQDDYAPRYFLPLLVPVILIVVSALDALRLRYPRTLPWIALVMTGIIGSNMAVISHSVRRPTYDFYNAAMSIQRTVHESGDRAPLLLGVSGGQMSLMAGIPSINDAYGTQDLVGKVLRYQPGWYICWNNIDEDDQAALAPFRLQLAATYKVFDDADRNRLMLFRMLPAATGIEPQRQAARDPGLPALSTFPRQPTGSVGAHR